MHTPGKENHTFGSLNNGLQIHGNSTTSVSVADSVDNGRVRALSIKYTVYFLESYSYLTCLTDSSSQVLLHTDMAWQALSPNP